MAAKSACDMINRIHQDILERMRKQLMMTYEPYYIALIGEDYLKEMVTKIQKYLTLSTSDLSCLEDLINHLINDMRPKMQDVAKELCLGCQAKHPSQLQHGLCTLTSDHQRFTVTFDKAWDSMYMQPYMDQVKHVVKQRMEPPAETRSINPPSMLNMLVTSAGITSEEGPTPVESTPVTPVDDLIPTTHSPPIPDPPVLDYFPPPSEPWIPTDFNLNCDDINFYDFKQNTEPVPATSIVNNDIMTQKNLPKKRPLNENEKMSNKKGRPSKKAAKCPSCTNMNV